MALTIKEDNGIFIVSGILNATTSKAFQAHFECILNTTDTLTLEIENLKEMDYNGIKAVKALSKYAYANYKDFSVIDLALDTHHQNVA